MARRRKRRSSRRRLYGAALKAHQKRVKRTRHRRSR